LPTESFDAQSLSGTVSAVPRTSSCFLVCHTHLPLNYVAFRVSLELRVVQDSHEPYMVHGKYKNDF
jgi:hypothetical protein